MFFFEEAGREGGGQKWQNRKITVLADIWDTKKNTTGAPAFEELTVQVNAQAVPNTQEPFLFPSSKKPTRHP